MWIFITVQNTTTIPRPPRERNWAATETRPLLRIPTTLPAGASHPSSSQMARRCRGIHVTGEYFTRRRRSRCVVVRERVACTQRARCNRVRISPTYVPSAVCVSARVTQSLSFRDRRRVVSIDFVFSPVYDGRARICRGRSFVPRWPMYVCTAAAVFSCTRVISVRQRRRYVYHAFDAGFNYRAVCAWLLASSAGRVIATVLLDMVSAREFVRLVIWS